MFGDSLSHESDVYSLTLTICSILLCVGSLCGCIYEIMRRKKRAKVQPEGMRAMVTIICLILFDTLFRGYEIPER
jgi:hypothetical protein